MKIVLGELYNNKTRMYLRPCIKSFGSDFISRYSPIHTLAVGIHDTSVGEFNPENRYIYIMLDRAVKSELCADFIQWLSVSEKYFVKDYLVDETHRHMIVLKLPDRFQKAYDNFLAGKYSEMFSEKEIEYLNFCNFPNKTPYLVLTKDQSYLKSFTNILNNRFDSSLSEKDVEKLEYEFPWNLNPETEIFNYK